MSVASVPIATNADRRYLNQFLSVSSVKSDRQYEILTPLLAFSYFSPAPSPPASESPAFWADQSYHSVQSLPENCPSYFQSPDHWSNPTPSASEKYPALSASATHHHPRDPSPYYPIPTKPEAKPWRPHQLKRQSGSLSSGNGYRAICCVCVYGTVLISQGLDWRWRWYCRLSHGDLVVYHHRRIDAHHDVVG